MTINSQIGTVTSISVPNVTDALIDNVVIALADTEQSYTFPAGSKQFLIRPRGPSKITLSHTATESGTKYLTIWPGSNYKSAEFVNASKTIYFQSPTAGLEVELEWWF